MEEKVELLKRIADNAILSLKRITETGVKRAYDFEIDCERMEDYTDRDIRNSEQYSTLFRELSEIKGPVLYWFEIVSNTSCNSILEGIRQYKQEGGKRAVPAIKKKLKRESKILYVGKVKGVFWGRIITHLGYFTTPATQGLQLFYWGGKIGLKVKVNALEFHNDCQDLLPVFEYAFAKELHPIIGKHK